MADRYGRVLCSLSWIERKEEIMEARGRACEECGAEGVELQLHHTSYDRLGDELDTDLVLVCVECHCRLHGWW
jgi:hypothetical protein